MILPDVPLVGRERELAALVGAFTQARAGTGRLVQLRTGPGAGASALLDQLRRELGGRGLAHRWVGSRGSAGDSAYAALAGLLGTGPGHAARAQARPATAEGLDVLLAGLQAVPVEARPSVVGDRLGRILAQGPQPLVVVVERADALDPLAAAALATTLRVLRGTRTLAVLTSDGEPDRAADLVLELGPLGDADARRLADLVAPGDPGRAETLVELSGGMPGRLVSLSRWPDPRVPARDQLRTLNPGAAGLVTVAALAAGRLAAAELAAAAGCDPGLVALCQVRGVLRRRGSGTEPTGDGPGDWEVPSHWAAVAASCLSAGSRRDLARATAVALSAADAPARLCARALDAAGDPSAADAWLAAAHESGPDMDERAACLLRAWSLADGVAGSERVGANPDLGRRCADALLAVGRIEDARSVLAAALPRVPRRDRAARARLLAVQHRALLQAGDHAQADRVLAQARDSLPDDPPQGDPALARAMAECLTLASLAQVGDDPAAAAALADRAVRSAVLAGSPHARAAALGAMALATGLGGDRAGSGALFEEALTLADETGDRALEARIAANRIYAQWRSGDLVGMEGAVSAELARLRATGLAEAAGGQLLVARAVVLHGLGRWAELTDHLERTLERPGRLGAQVELLLRLVAVELAADVGRVGDARAGLEALQARPGVDDPEIAYEVLAVRLGIATLALDVPRAAAEQLAADALATAGRITGDAFAAARVRVAALRLRGWASGRPAGPVPIEPGAPAPSAAPDGLGPGGDTPAELCALLHEQAAWTTGTGWSGVIDAWAALPMPHRQAWAQVSAAHEAADRGDPATALDLVDRALATATALGSEPVRARAERLARQVGRRAPRGPGELTARERDVLQEVAHGRTNREIARALGMSDRTVAVHLTRIFAKLGAGTRGEAVHLARHRGLVDQ